MRPILERLTVIKTAKMVAGQNVFQFDLGNPHGPVLAAAKARLIQEAENNKNWRYQPSRGVPELQEAICARVNRRHCPAMGLVPTKHVVVTRGSKAALAHMLRLFLSEGDYAIVPNPCYAILHDGVVLAHAIPISYNCGPGVDVLSEIKLACNYAPTAKLIIVNLPHNPTGAFADSDFFPALVKLAKDRRMKVISDLAYEDLAFNGSIEQPAESIINVPDWMDVAVETRSMTKGHNMAGNVGFVIGNEEMVRALADFQTNYGYGVFAPLQFAAATALNLGDRAVQQNCLEYKRRDSLLTSGLNSVGWEVSRTLATIYKWVAAPEGFGGSAEEFCEWLLMEANVAVWPASGFINPPRPGHSAPDWSRHVRFSMVEPLDRIPSAIKAIGDALKSHKG